MRVLCRSVLALAAVLLLSCDGKTAADRAAEEGILLFGNSSEPQGLDPQLVSGVLESNIIRALFEGLCVEHPSKDGIALPGAAKSWDHNEDFTVWTFHLGEDRLWSDGTPVTTKDFLFSYERMLTPKLGAEYAEMLYYIKGAEAFHKGESADFSTVGVKGLDDYTLEITLRGSLPFLPEITKHYTWYPVPRHVILHHNGRMDDPDSRWTMPENLVSNGPFTLKSWRINDHIEVEKNPRYWDADAVALNGIRFLPVNNTYTEARMFFDGLMHVTYTLPPELIPYANQNYPEEVRSELYLGTKFLRCNVTREALQDPRVRRALAMAIDRKSLIDNVLQGGQQPAYGMVPPFGNYETPHLVDFDREEAARLFAEAGYGPDGPKKFPVIKLLTTDRDVSKRLAEAYQGMLAQNLGVTVEIEQKEWTSYLVAMTNLDYDLADSGWIGDYLDPTTFLDMWIGGGGNNRTGWSNAEFEKLLKESEHVPDALDRLAVLQEAEKILMGEIPAIPVYWYTTNYLIDRRVEGWSPLLLNNHPYKFISLKPSAP